MTRTLCLCVLLTCGCGTTKTVDPDQNAALAALKPYGATHKVDASGNVIDLVLEGKQVDDAALDEVARCVHLRRLSLYGSSISDAGLLKLHALPKLEALGLGETSVSGKGLANLKTMAALSHLWVSRNGRVTPESVAALKRDLPGLVVHPQ